jgi:anaerobic C4-dicarboxylate transporter
VVGGKAIASWIPYTIIGFEVMVLVGALSTVYGMFILSRVPKITQTIGFDERFTGGHYGIYVETEPERLKEAEAVLRNSGAVEVRNER